MSKRPSLATSMKALAEDTTPDPMALTAKSTGAPAPGIAKPAATRAGMKRLLTPVAPELHKRLKLLAVKQDTTLEALTRAALESYLSQHDSN
jgi:hypothetical protein